MIEIILALLLNAEVTRNEYGVKKYEIYTHDIQGSSATVDPSGGVITVPIMGDVPQMDAQGHVLVNCKNVWGVKFLRRGIWYMCAVTEEQQERAISCDPDELYNQKRR